MKSCYPISLGSGLHDPNFHYFSFCSRDILQVLKIFQSMLQQQKPMCMANKIWIKAVRPQSLNPQQCQDHHNTSCFHKVKDKLIQMQPKG